ncbi:hypothetical protein [Streptomyces sp. 35G-GA-8]|uniref:hypothetical protein n=1 Tax=Streptomyces sp. 35G-GA-8 TaxID=2939434 RepID=UPI00201F136C|nr:hypothetical protein [Streptomyces sp. 35G-GA-8]MCL7376987.1 hypothetical protein [Streptomyces sp. 35G-GA-8]
MRTRSDLVTAINAIDWDDPRQCADNSRTTLRRLADNRELFTDLVHTIGREPYRLARCETHPIISRLCLAEGPHSLWQLRLHVFPDGERDLTPHDHKYPFAVHVVSGGYVHVWNRRTGKRQTGEFSSHDVSPGIVTVERPTTGYLLANSLVHQTALGPETITLFLRGPVRHQRWHAASDMQGAMNGFEAPPQDGGAYRGSAPMTVPEYQSLVGALAKRAIINPGRPS